MKTLTASDRAVLIKLASELPKGDETRKAILAGLKDKTATTYPDTAQGAIAFLSSQAKPSVQKKLLKAKAIPDPQVDKVWKITMPGMTVIVYLPGSLAGGLHGDFEEIE